MPHFENEAAMRKTMADAVALTNYMRDYIWSIGIDRMRPAQEENVRPLIPNQQAPSTPPATPAGEVVRRASSAPAAPNTSRR
jgi:hypothetical protein